MCVNKKLIINRYSNKAMYVNCGKCPACIQEKALMRTNRIKNDRSQDGSTLTLFVTLTYDNRFMPYVLYGESLDAFCEDEGIYCYRPVYRDFNARYFKGRLIVTPNSKPLFELRSPVEIPVPKIYLKGQDESKVSISYYKDAQDFLKRLRENLPNGINFKYFCCSEYGPTTLRSHFHLLFTIPSKAVELFTTAIVKSWPFADNVLTRQNIQVARDAASYVSSYVNCSTFLPSFYKDIPEISPRHSFSRGYGFALPEFTFEGVWSAYLRNSLRYDLPQTISGKCTHVSILIPSYVIRRYFPLFKGYNRLATDEVISILLRPDSLYRYASKMQIDDSEVHTISVQLRNAILRALDCGVNWFDYAFAFPRVWSLRRSHVLGDFYNSIVQLKDNLQAYDNLSALGVSVSNYTLEDLASTLVGVPELDPNNFTVNKAKTSNLEKAFYSYSKDRKIRNYIYSNYFQV